MYIYCKILDNGKVLKGLLKRTQTEVCYKPLKYKWIDVFALLDDKGRWLSFKYWKLNQRSKADKELLKDGWKHVKCSCCGEEIITAYYTCQRGGNIYTVCQECRYQDKTKQVYEYYTTI